MGRHREKPDSAVVGALGGRLARHRLQRNLTQAQLAQEAGISKRTLIRLEKGESSQLVSLIRVVRALGLLDGLDALVPPPLTSPIEQVRLRKKERRRASPGAGKSGPGAGKLGAKRPAPGGGWMWGDEAPKRGGGS